MTQGSPAAFAAYLAAYRAELLRWNRRINLVSRQNTEQVLETLFQQCVGGVEALWVDLAGGGAPGPVFYFDLGSGGGLPGVIWHRFLCDRAPRVRTWLVEPREKRAWFLERLSGLAGSPPLSVVCGRWEDTPPVVDEDLAGEPACRVVVSLKALHLTDPEVLTGLGSALPGSGPCPVAIARYYPTDQRLDQALRDHLLIPPSGAPAAAGPGGLTAAGAEILAWPRSAGASLVLSRYR